MTDIVEEQIERLSGDARRLYESFRRLGMGPAAALGATRGREGVADESPAEIFEDMFRRQGKTPEQCRRLAESALEGRTGSLREVGPVSRSKPGESTSLGLPLTHEEEQFRAGLRENEQRLLSEAAARIANENGLAGRYGSDARQVAEEWLLKESHRRMKEEEGR